jgi:hypothetical protein
MTPINTTNYKEFIYINNMAALFANDKDMKRFLNNKIGHKKWVIYNEIYIPEHLGMTDKDLDERFFNGIAVSQFSMIKRGGTFINPMLYAMNMNFSMWNHILHNEPDFRQHVRYIDVPYELYYESAKRMFVDPVPEEDYDAVSNNIVNMVDQIKDDFYVNSMQIH